MSVHSRRFCLCLVLTFQAFFVFAYFAVQHTPTFPLSSFFRTVAAEELDWIVAEAQQLENFARTDLIFKMVNSFFLLGIINGIFKYYFSRSKHCRHIIDVIIPAVWLILYGPVYFQIKYRIEHYTLWMELVPTQVLALILFSLCIRDWLKERRPIR